MTLLLLATSAFAETVTLDAYIASLQRIDAALAAKQLTPAQADARALIGDEVQSPHGRFRADDALLNEIANAKKIDLHLQSRLATTIAELRRLRPEAAPTPNNELLVQVQNAQRVAELPKGGEVALTRPANLTILEKVAESIAKAWNWIIEIVAEFLDWIFSFFPRARGGGAAGGGIGMLTIVVTVMIVLVIIVLAARVLRSSRRAKPEVVESIEPIASKRDEDPLSRGATEWERYAAQLAAAGRLRESIRAWYHAVLVTLYASGILHFRKGRTNWEYVSALAPSLPWRAEFVELTRRFEREWYGHFQSSREAYDDCSSRARAILETVRRASRGAA